MLTISAPVANRNAPNVRENVSMLTIARGGAENVSMLTISAA
jgi:hypothetical protein